MKMKSTYVACLAVAMLAWSWGCQRQAAPDQYTPPPAAEAAEAAEQPEADEGATPDTTDYVVDSRPDDAGIDQVHVVVDGGGEAVELPENVARAVAHSRSPTLFADGRYILFESEEGDGLHVYDFHRTHVLDLELDSFDMPQTDVFEYGKTSPNQRHVMAAIGDYEQQQAYLFVYTIDDGQLLATRSTQINPHMRCSSGCHIYDIGFKDNDSVVYVERADEPEPAGDDRVEVEVSLEEMSQ